MDQGTLHIFSAIVTSIVLEAAPFLLLGSLLSSILAVFAGDGAFERIGNRPVAVQIVIGLAAGLILPTCECGVVPVTRRLLRKGVPSAAAISFMLAAPVVNPVSIASTWVAFQGDMSMVLWRVALVAVPAAILGWSLAGGKGRDLLRPSLDMAPGCGCGYGGDHDQATPGPLPARLVLVLRHTASEFMDMGRLLILGACAAGAFKVFLPQDVLGLVSGSLWLAVPALMLLAVLMSICSEADAFVAASLSMFPRPALLAFLALGPVLDLKLLPAFFSVFKRRIALAVVLVPACVIYILAMSLGLLEVLP
ncbi:MAG: permease [Humidesulfovibrio sp.]|nr:permease [Humidesulfovibrio sp.]